MDLGFQFMGKRLCGIATTGCSVTIRVNVSDYVETQDALLVYDLVEESRSTCVGGTLDS